MTGLVEVGFEVINPACAVDLLICANVPELIPTNTNRRRLSINFFSFGMRQEKEKVMFTIPFLGYTIIDKVSCCECRVFVD